MSVYDEIRAEREKQKLKYSIQHDARHNSLEWMALFAKQLGDMARHHYEDHGYAWRKSAIQLAALIVAALE